MPSSGCGTRPLFPGLGGRDEREFKTCHAAPCLHRSVKSHNRLKNQQETYQQAMTERSAVQDCRFVQQTFTTEELTVYPGPTVRAAERGNGDCRQKSARVLVGMKFANLSIPDGRQQTAVVRCQRKSFTERFCMESVICDQCGDREHSPYLTMEDHIFHVPGTFSIVQCTSCGLLYTNPRPTGIELRGLYATYYDGNGSSSALPPDLLPSFGRHPGHAVHVACTVWSVFQRCHPQIAGEMCWTSDAGQATSWNRSGREGCRAYGVEPNAASAEICRRNGFEVYTGSFEDLPFSSELFRLRSILWHSIEHLSSPRNALAKIKRILKPDGQVLIWCPNADSSPAALFHQFWFGWHLPFHFYHFTPKTITALAETAGFRVEKLRAVTPEFVFAHSLQAWMKHQKGSDFTEHRVDSLLRTFVARAMIALVFRIHDHALTEKGEFLQVELVPVTE